VWKANCYPTGSILETFDTYSVFRELVTAAPYIRYLPRGVASAIRETWSQLTTTFQNIRIPTQTDQERSYLLTQEINQAGFYHDDTQPKSVTRAITIEIETARGKQLTKRIVETLPKEKFRAASIFELW
jgi:hypothetical protein